MKFYWEKLKNTQTDGFVRWYCIDVNSKFEKLKNTQIDGFIRQYCTDVNSKFMYRFNAIPNNIPTVCVCVKIYKLILKLLI